MFDPIKEAVCPRLKSCWPCVRPDFAVHRLNRKGLLLLLIRTPISPTVIIILPSHCCSVYYAVQDFFFSPTYFRHARLIPVDVRVTFQHTRDSVFQSWKSWKGGMKWEANNKKYKVLGKRREKKRKLSADFCVRDDITTEHSVGDIKGTSQPSTLFFFPSKFFFFFQLGHVEARESESFSPLFYPRIPFCASFGRATHSKATRQGDLPTDGCSEAVEWRRRRRQYRANEK